MEAAANLIYVSGAGGMNLEQVMEASRTSKSQLYHYFPDKDALVEAVVDLQTTKILGSTVSYLYRLDSFEALVRWRNAMVASYTLEARWGGCPLGSLANELSTQSGGHRSTVATSLEAWRNAIQAGLAHMQRSGRIVRSADTQSIATAVLSAVQGGYLLSKASRDVKPFELALDMALEHVKRHAEPHRA